MLLLLVVAVNSRHAVPVSHSGWQKTTLDVSEGFFGWARGNLRSDFSDVTLACDDGSLQAHKVLSWPLPQHSGNERQMIAERILNALCFSHHLGTRTVNGERFCRSDIK